MKSILGCSDGTKLGELCNGGAAPRAQPSVGEANIRSRRYKWRCEKHDKNNSSDTVQYKHVQTFWISMVPDRTY